MESMFDLTGRVALVTGSAQGLGFEMAKGLTRAGAHVLVNGRDKEHVANAVALIKSLGGSAQALVFDVSVDSARAAALSTIASEHDRLDILINNVGIRDRRPIEEIDGPDLGTVTGQPDLCISSLPGGCGVDARPTMGTYC